MTVVAFDTETFLFGPGNLSPRVVCASFATAKQPPKVISNGDQDRLPNTIRRLLSNSDIHLVGHRVAYDLCCVGNTWPDLWPLIFKALNSERVHDTLIQEKLINLATTGDLETGLTGKRLSYSLAAIAKRRLGAVLEGKDRGDEGEDPWRYRYHELDGKPSSEYPKEAHDFFFVKR